MSDFWMFLVGALLGYVVCLRQVGKVSVRWLKRALDGENTCRVVDISDDLWDAMIPVPLSWLVDAMVRREERKSQ